MQVVAQHHGVSVGRQLREIFALRYGPGKLTPQEYYRFHLYRRSISMADKRLYKGDVSGRVLNISLTAPKLRGAIYALDDKLTLLALCKESDIPATPVQAVFSSLRKIGGWPVLATHEDLTQFLLYDARYPIFAKPANGRQSTGGVQIERLDDDGHLRFLGDVQGPHVDSFAAEVIAKFPSGYIFQDCARMAKELLGLTPDAIGPLRIITIMDQPHAPSVLFACFRLPVSGTETGPGKAKARLFANVDVATSEINRVIDRTNGGSRIIDTQPLTGQKLLGLKIEQMPDAFELVLRAHLMAPDVGIVGWDVAITDQGPLIMEGNKNPALTLIQVCQDRGALNPDYAPRFAAAKARADAQSAAIKAGQSTWELGAIREVVALERGKLKT